MSLNFILLIGRRFALIFLGIKSLLPFNRALLSKWLRRFVVERERERERGFLLSSGLKKYASLAGGWSINVVARPYGVSLWK
jgi:hypothetical protein